MPLLRALAPFVGLNLIDDESSIRENEATQALNVNLDRGLITKRDGYVGVTTTTDVLGITDYRKLDGTVQQIIKSGTNLKKLTGGVLSTIGTGLTADTLADFAIYNDRCYVVDGKFRVTDGASTFSPSITAPNISGLTVTKEDYGLGIGGLGGTYDYKFTYKSVAWQVESPASAASATQELSDQQVAFTDIPRSTDARVDKIRIYRRKPSEQGTMWFLVTEIANPGSGTASYTDIVLDEAVDPFEFAPLSESYVFDNLGFKHIELHNGVMFLAGDNSELYFSLPDRPTVITDKLIVGNDAQHGKITGLLSWQGLLYVFKEDSIWSVDGLTKDTFNVSSVTRGVGCYSGQSIVPTDGAVYFLGEDSILAFDGKQVGDAGERIRPLMQSRVRNRDAFVVGENDKDNRSIIWSFTPEGETTNTKCVVLFYGNTTKADLPSWATWEFKDASKDPAPLQCMARVTVNSATFDRKLWYGFSAKVGEPGGVKDDGTGDFALIWTTGKWDAESPEKYKHWGNFSIEVDREVADFGFRALKVSALLDTSKIPLFERDRSMVRTIHTTRVRARSRDIQLEFRHDSTSAGCTIVSFVLYGKGAGAFRARRT